MRNKLDYCILREIIKAYTHQESSKFLISAKFLESMSKAIEDILRNSGKLMSRRDRWTKTGQTFISGFNLRKRGNPHEFIQNPALTSRCNPGNLFDECRSRIQSIKQENNQKQNKIIDINKYHFSTIKSKCSQSSCDSPAHYRSQQP